ncbi:hypothetical protein [Fictibacillus sp. NRS-1165]|uniref:hypothetical protein n=1 Tax=Fictibacillus sp. NRS-1165 TaxID=3144463 RepID=UPI003D1E237D
MDIDLGPYSRIVEKLEKKDGASVLLIDSDNHIMYANDSALIGKSVPSHLKKQISSASGKTNENILFSKPYQVHSTNGNW